MAEFQADLRDIRFALFDVLGIQNLVASPRYEDHGKEMYELVLEQVYRFARERLGPLNAVGDRQGCDFSDGEVTLAPGFKEAYKDYVADGWGSPTASPEWGGMGLPMAIAAAAGDMFMGGCCSFMFTPGLCGAAARVITHCGSEELKNTYVHQMNAGVWSGTMCLTEPQAGSAVGDVTTIATPQSDGSYRIAGTKIFISQGEHDLTENIIHLVLARTPDAPSGTKGLSLFLVPKFLVNDDGSLGTRNDVRCTGIEEKMGIHGSPTCSLLFGEEEACVGYLIGEIGAGMRNMFLMMNEARLEVGAQGVALGNAAYQLALAYAKERVQGVHVREFRNPDAERVTIVHHPNVRRMLLECKAFGEGTRALLYKTAYYADQMEIADDEAERERLSGHVEVLTPIVKAYCSEAGMHIADLSIQVFGGYGYCKEYGVEQHLRDVKIASIYEGTNSIQAIDLIARKVARGGGKYFMTLMMEIDKFIGANNEHHGLEALITKLSEAKNALVGATMSFAGNNMQGDVEYPVMQCKQYLEMFGDVVVAWALLEQAAVASERCEALQEQDPEATPENHSELRFFDGKVKTATFFVHQILPRVHGHAGRITSNDRSALNITF